jgi:hypothetical protein
MSSYLIISNIYFRVLLSDGVWKASNFMFTREGHVWALYRLDSSLQKAGRTSKQDYYQKWTAV